MPYLYNANATVFNITENVIDPSKNDDLTFSLQRKRARLVTPLIPTGQTRFAFSSAIIPSDFDSSN